MKAWRQLFLRALRVRVSFTAQARLMVDGPCIVICNHESLLDGVIFALAAPVSMDYAVTPKYAVENAVTRCALGFLERCGLGRVIPLSADRSIAIRGLHRSLVAGRSVMIFPTGTISPGDEKNGYLWLSQKTGCPIVRASISGASDSKLFAVNGKYIWPKIELTI